MLLKVILFAYAQGIVGSRGIERACREHVTFIALCGDSSPHFTTIANFVSTLGEDIARVFAAVLAICDRQGLIGREMFANDGVKLPSNASKAKSGTRSDFERQATKLEAAAKIMLARHRAEDAKPIERDLAAKEPDVRHAITTRMPSAGARKLVLDLLQITCRSSSTANIINATQATVKATVRAMKRLNPLM